MSDHTITTIQLLYNNHIYERYKSLINSGLTNENLDNKQLSKIFEYYSCIKLMNEYNQIFYEYGDIDPEFKEINKMTKQDTGIDASNLTDTIVQCKLRSNYLTWKECSTFVASQNQYCIESDEYIIRWKKLIITRNNDCKFSSNLDQHHKFKKFIDKSYDKNEIFTYCENLLQNQPIIKEEKKNIILRDYQIECNDLINNSKKNVIICLPTGTGKNLIILNSLKENLKYLILVPRIILMEQITEELNEKFPNFKNTIQCIGGGNTIYNETKNICICVYNSIDIITPYTKTFEKIFVDEAHHIKTPKIYTDNIDEENCEEDIEEDYEEDEEDYEEDEEDYEEIDDNINDGDDLNNLKYINKIISLSQNNNNVYLSATIDKQKDFIYYKKDIREMIEKGYLCDYTINIPIFNEDPTNKSVCSYLINNYRNIIIYCNSQKEGENINKLMNEIQKDTSVYIDCKTSNKQRKTIIEKFKNNEIPFLVNVRILTEGFNAPITQGVCMLHLPSNQETIIQIIGRALRLDENNEFKIAKIILPFSSKGDENSINHFLKVIAKNDSRIYKSYKNKIIGGYANIIKNTGDDNEEEEEDEEEENEEEDDNDAKNEINLKFNMIFDNMGKLTNSKELFLYRLEELKTYIDTYNQRPSNSSKDKSIKSMAQWKGHCQTNYTKKIYNMKDETIYKLWTEFINDENYKKYIQLPTMLELFNDNLNELKLYIDTHNQRPSKGSPDKTIKSMAQWLNDCQKYYTKKLHNMKDETIYNLWTEFINNEKYKKYFLSQYNKFINDLNELKLYIDTNKQRPSNNSKDKTIKSMAIWISNCQTNYTKKKERMSDETIRKLWEEFINDEKYKKYIQLPTLLELFNDNLNELKLYIDTHNQRPSKGSPDKTIKSMAQWLNDCQKYYTKKLHNMKDETIYNLWTEFINNEKYKKYFNTSS